MLSEHRPSLQKGTTQNKMQSVLLRAQQGQVKIHPCIVGLAQNEVLNPLGTLATDNCDSLILKSTILIPLIKPNEKHENETYR